MIDHATHIESVVKDELSKASLASGIDKTMAGFIVSPIGPVPVQTADGTAMIPSWVLTVTLRTDLIGMPPVPAPILIPGPLPGDDDFRGATRAALKGCVDARDKMMRGEQ